MRRERETAGAFHRSTVMAENREPDGCGCRETEKVKIAAMIFADSSLLLPVRWATSGISQTSLNEQGPSPCWVPAPVVALVLVFCPDAWGEPHLIPGRGAFSSASLCCTWPVVSIGAAAKNLPSRTLFRCQRAARLTALRNRRPSFLQGPALSGKRHPLEPQGSPALLRERRSEGGAEEASWDRATLCW